jgi:hypothetical protein
VIRGALAAAALLSLAASAVSAAPNLGTVRPETGEEVQQAAGVVQLDPLHNQGSQDVKLFGTAGGDPAMNGLYTYLAFYVSPADGWRVFRIGDFLSYRVIASSPGRIVLGVQESVMHEATGNISGRTRRLILSWRSARGAAAPASISITG